MRNERPLTLLDKERRKAIEAYWVSIEEIKEHTEKALERGTIILKSGHGYEALNIRPGHPDPIEIPISDAKRKRMVDSLNHLNGLSSSMYYRNDMRLLK